MTRLNELKKRVRYLSEQVSRAVGTEKRRYERGLYEAQLNLDLVTVKNS